MMTTTPRPGPTVHWERLHDAFPVFRTRYGDQLPPAWQADIVAATTGRELRYLSGESVTSRQRQLGSATEFVVGVVDGKGVASELPWLVDLYQYTLLELANQKFMAAYACSSDERSAINLNVLPVGSGYEWHVDTNPLTGLLFVTDHPEGTGGELEFRADPVTHPAEEWELVIRPRAGDLLLFDARYAAHHVRPVRGPGERITVPMNYYFAGESAARPDDLDKYLYGS